MKLHRNNGFTLLEMLMVVVIIGILATIAMPSYKDYVKRGARESAQTELLEMASVQEKIYLNSNGYTPSITGAYNGQAASTAGATTGGLGRTSGKTKDGKYTLTIDIVAPSQTYKLTATPTIGKPQEDDGCLTIEENGRRQWHEKIDACTSTAPKTW